ncbi:LpqB family beta-propeller domain-containing protein [Streptosporangium sp. NBC_01755]|uniref:LpqB family beta-propeller domain-containing protein n=1 Tax=unclassified Streptosporangium TaxID=2632669 RepID=UPI002DD92083|nr:MULTISPECIES: LpqB family beta-propeller domain-containing protein [unclassified Streptosporangium]WSA24093.1 LpqB family beta-propeller domain-containing protein [Streptosporangium sp. NBC_01810]WSC97835.1 LpqB family beta-propeller domain-containing protein [Streptosporangium sp. NBC_01755]
MPAESMRKAGTATLAVALAVALVFGVTACSVIPTGGKSVVAVDNERKGNPLDNPYARVIAMPPKAAWSPQEVVTGFRAAMASPDDPDFRVAREYLTDDFADKWNPHSGVTVYRQGDYERFAPLRDEDKHAQVTLKGTKTAVIDQDGRYRPSGGLLNQPFTLAKDAGGEWRISAAPDGLLLSEADVARGYLPVDLYFLDSQWKGLVVDQVRVPIDPGANFAKTTVERLLRGPSSSLKGAVRSAFAGTELIDVTTENNRVVVDLTERVDPGLIDPMSAQLAATLTALTQGGWGFEVKVNGESYYADTPLQIDAQEQSNFDPWTSPDTAASFYLADGALWLLDKENVGRPVPGRAGQKESGLTRPAISGQSVQQVAALSRDGRSVSVAPLAAGGEWRVWTTGESLIPPSWDRHHTLWTVDRPNDHASIVTRHDGDNKHRYRVSAPDLETVYVKSLKVARDGVHVAVVVKDGLGEQVHVGTVIGERENTRITNLQVVVDSENKRTIEDIAWKDGKTLYALTGKSELLEASVTAEPKPLAFDSRIGIESITALDGILLAGAKDDQDNRQVLYWNSTKWEPLVKNETGSTDFTENGPSSPAFPLG